MRKTLKYLALTLFLLGNLHSWAQSRVLHHENTYLFEILKYEREPSIPTYIKKGIEKAAATPQPNWSAQDSLFHAYENVYLQKYEAAFNNFVRLNTDTIQEKLGQILYRTTLFKFNRLEVLNEYNTKTLPKEEEKIYTYKDAFRDLTNAYLLHQEKEYDPDSTLIFPILKADTLKNFNKRAQPHQNKYVEVAFAIDSAFRQFTILHDDRDYILSRAFEEMGDFQKEFLYITNAYFYYSAALFYDKNNSSVIDKYNATGNEINDKNLIQISFKNKFAKVIKNRYRLKNQHIEKVQRPELSPETYIPPPPSDKADDKLPWLDLPLLLIILFSGLLIFVVFFLKSKD